MQHDPELRSIEEPFVLNRAERRLVEDLFRELRLNHRGMMKSEGELLARLAKKRVEEEKDER